MRADPKSAELGRPELSNAEQSRAEESYAELNELCRAVPSGAEQLTRVELSFQSGKTGKAGLSFLGRLQWAASQGDSLRIIIRKCLSYR